MDNINPEALEAFSINEAYENAWQQSLSDRIANAVAGKFSTPVSQIPPDVLQHIKSQERKISELQQQLSQVSVKADTSYNYVTPRRATQLDLVKLFGNEKIDLNPTARTPIDDMKRELLTFALSKRVDINWKEIPSLLKDGLGLDKKCFNGSYCYEGGRLRPSVAGQEVGKQPSKQPGSTLPTVSMSPQTPRSPTMTGTGTTSPAPVISNRQ